MKNLLLSFTFIFISITAFSQKIKIESGSVDFLKNEKSIGAIFTYESMQVGGMLETDYIKGRVTKGNEQEAGKGDKWLEAWTEDRETRFRPKFIELFNEQIKTKNGPAIDDEHNYIMKINTHFAEPGFNVGVMRKNAAVSMTCRFIHKETGDEIALISVTNASANSFWGADFDTGFRLQESYAKAGRELAQFIIKKLGLK